jgi:hypothetical protein
MDAFDRQVVQFVVWWAPFGGPPPEETLPRFGLTPPHLAQRFNQIVTRLADAGAKLDHDDAELLATARRFLPLSSAVLDDRAHSDNPARRIGICDAKTGPASSAGSPEVISSKVRPYRCRPLRQR